MRLITQALGFERERDVFLVGEVEPERAFGDGIERVVHAVIEDQVPLARGRRVISAHGGPAIAGG